VRGVGWARPKRLPTSNIEPDLFSATGSIELERLGPELAFLSKDGADRDLHIPFEEGAVLRLGGHGPNNSGPGSP